MKSRMYMGIGILLVFLFAGLGSVHYLKTACQTISEPLNPVQTEIVDAVEEAHRRWQKSRNAISLLADQTPIEQIDAAFTETLSYAKLQDLPEFTASCQRLSTLLKNLADAHGLTIWNVI